MKVLMVEPGKAAYEADIGESLDEMQKIVGGYIQAVYPYEESVALVCNEEGKNEGLPLNRALRDETGSIYDIIAGTFFVCGLGKDNFASLTQKDMTKFKRQFRDPEMFTRINGKILAVKVSEQYFQRHDQPHKSNDRER